MAGSVSSPHTREEGTRRQGGSRAHHQRTRPRRLDCRRGRTGGSRRRASDRDGIAHGTRRHAGDLDCCGVSQATRPRPHAQGASGARFAKARRLPERRRRFASLGRRGLSGHPTTTAHKRSRVCKPSRRPAGGQAREPLHRREHLAAAPGASAAVPGTAKAPPALREGSAEDRPRRDSVGSRPSRPPTLRPGRQPSSSTISSRRRPPGASASTTSPTRRPSSAAPIGDSNETSPIVGSLSPEPTTR